MKNEVCCIVVTYNRKKELLTNIKQLLKQSVSCDILIFNNASSDGTEEYLTENEVFKMNNIIYHYSEENIGGAGGFSKGLELAYNLGYKFFWLMDDDGHPANSETLSNCLSKMKLRETRDTIVNSLVICEENRLSFEMCKTKEVSVVINDSVNNVLENQIRPFNGTLIAREVVSKIGFPRADFFIKGDEVEYFLRAKNSHVWIVTAVDSLYYHPELIDRKVNVFGKKVGVSDESYWKEYYKTRNYFYICREYLGMIGLLKHLTLTFIKLFCFKTDKKRKIAYTFKGLMDGFNNKFERIKIG